MAGTNSTLGGGGFHHVAVPASDFDRSVSFYKDVLGFKPAVAWGEAPNRAMMLDAGKGDYIEIFERPDFVKPSRTGMDTGDAPVLHFAIRVASCDDAMKAALEAGCEEAMATKDVDIPATLGPAQPLPVRIGFVTGPSGELIEFFQNEDT